MVGVVAAVAAAPRPRPDDATHAQSPRQDEQDSGSLATTLAAAPTRQPGHPTHNLEIGFTLGRGADQKRCELYATTYSTELRSGYIPLCWLAALSTQRHGQEK